MVALIQQRQFAKHVFAVLQAFPIMAGVLEHCRIELILRKRIEAGRQPGPIETFPPSTYLPNRKGCAKPSAEHFSATLRIAALHRERR